MYWVVYIWLLVILINILSLRSTFLTKRLNILSVFFPRIVPNIYYWEYVLVVTLPFCQLFSRGEERGRGDYCIWKYHFTDDTIEHFLNIFSHSCTVLNTTPTLFIRLWFLFEGITFEFSSLTSASESNSFILLSTTTFFRE